jgi:putative ABC transport system substrate-binding protein
MLSVPCAQGQTGKPLRRVGVLRIGDATGSVTASPGLREGLTQLGLVEGRDIVLDTRVADGRTEGLAQLAAELGTLRPAVIVAYGPQATRAALVADPDIPVVAIIGDAVAFGFAATLTRPGGRVTGVSFLGTPLAAKRLELLAELLPKGGAVLNLGDSGTRTAPLDEALAAAARSLGLVLHTVWAGTPQEIDAAFAAARRLRAAGINVLGSPFLNSQRARIIDLAAKAQLPAIYQWPGSAREGGLMAYGPSLSAMDQQLASYVARILRGAKAGDLPIEQPTRFELVINQKVAKALGITIPPSLLLRADEVIQ